MCLGSAGAALRMTTHLVLQPLITDQCLTGSGGLRGAGWEHTLHLSLSSRVQEKQQRCRMSRPLLTLGAPQPPFWRRKVELHPPQVGFSASLLSPALSSC